MGLAAQSARFDHFCELNYDKGVHEKSLRYSMQTNRMESAEESKNLHHINRNLNQNNFLRPN